MPSIKELPLECSRSLQESVDEVERELNVRRKCFDRWVGDGRLAQTDALDRFQRMCSAWHYLKRCLTGEPPAQVDNPF